MIFTSLQVLRNTYRFNYEKTNLLSKKSFATYFLDHFYHSMLIQRFLNFIEPNLKVTFLKKIFKKKKRAFYYNGEMYNVDFFYFVGSSWCLLLFKVVEFTSLSPSVFRLRPLKKRSFVSRKSLLRYNSVVLGFE